MLGICLGSQLIAKALGVTVGKGSGMEIGWSHVHKVEPQQNDGWFDGLEDHFSAFHWHGETFPIPQDATLLLGSDCYAHQAFSIGNTLGLQFHLEMTADMVREWVGLYQEDVHSGHWSLVKTRLFHRRTPGSHLIRSIPECIVTTGW